MPELSAEVRRLTRALETRAGFVTKRATRPERVCALLRAIAPVSTNIPLVRIGGDADGGYLIPDDLADIAFSISPGVAAEVSFDEALASQGIDVLMYDASVTEPPVTHERFHFRSLFLDSFDSTSTITLENILLQHTTAGSDLLLQMDIEGAEYRIIHSTRSESLNRFRIMVIEFHNMIDLLLPSRFDDIESCFLKLLKTHYVVHIHPNNVLAPFSVDKQTIPQIFEVTFLRRDRATSIDRRPILPNPMDQNCVPGRKTIPIATAWK